MTEATMNNNVIPAGKPNSVIPQHDKKKGIWSEFIAQPAVRKSLPLVVMVFGLLIMVVVYMALQKPALRPVFPGMTSADQAAVYDALSQAGMSVEIDTTNGAVNVPVDQFHEAKMLLARQGLPVTPVGGFEMIRQQQALGTSQFMEQKRYQLAMEEELANSIISIQSVKSARVHLAMPKQSVFVRNRVPTKASVVVTLAQGRSLSDGQARAVVHMVASSVPYLDPANVSVVDQYGNLVIDAKDDMGLGLSEKQLQYRKKLEGMYQQRIQSLLTPLVGADRFRAQVNAEIDFTVKEMTEENFNPATIAVRSEQISEKRNAAAKDAIGVPGALANEPPPTPILTTNQTAAEDVGNRVANVRGAGNLPETLNSTRNYEVDRTISHTKMSIGDLQRLSISVVIAEPTTTNAAGEQVRQSLTAEQIEQFTQLVQNAVGFNAERGDVVSLVGMFFQPQEVIPEAPLWQQAWLQNLVSQVLLAILALVFILVILRPVVKNLLVSARSVDELSAEALALANEQGAGEDNAEALEQMDGETLEEMKARMRPKKSTISPEMLDTANSYDDKVALMRMLIAEDSKRVAGVMSSWVKQDI